MRTDQSQEPPIALASPSVVGGGRPEAALGLAPLDSMRLGASLPSLGVSCGRKTGAIALAALILATFAIVATAAADPSILVPRSAQTFPGWEAGPLHNLFSRLITNPIALGNVFSGLMIALFVAYALVLASVRTLTMRTIAICIVALNLIILMSPPLQLTDVFNYLGYARLGGLHHLNPYTHVIKQEFFDPVYQLSSWHSLKSPYGPLFTAFTYPLALLPLAVAYWTIKVVTVALSLGFIALVGLCARQLGRDPRFAVAFVALNPIVLIYAVGGFHNDFFMLVPSMAAIALVLARRDRAAGAAVTVAIAIKFTAIVLLPFLLLAARSRQRWIRITAGAIGAAGPLAVLSVALFGLSIPNLSDQSSLLTALSLPNLVGWLIGIGGGAPGLLRVASAAVVVVIAFQLHRRRDWLAGAGWSTFALIASLAWLVPWYVIWLLPLAALGTDVRLRRTALALTLFLVIAFAPATGVYLAKHGIDPLASSVGQASKSRQQFLAQ